MTNIKFNSRYGIDLGSIETISVSGNKALLDKVLILRQNPNSGEYFLEPQDIGIQYGVNDNTLTLKDDETNYSKSHVFLSNSQLEEKTLFTFTLNFKNKSIGMLSIQGKLFAKETDTNKLFNNYVFTTGRNMSYTHLASNTTLNRHVYDKLLYLFNDREFRQVGSETYKEYAYLNRIGDKKYLEPIFSTIGNEGIIIETSKLPYIEIEETSDDVYNINIKCNPFRDSTTNIEWFGNFEIILTAS